MLKYVINKGVIIMTNKEIFLRYINGLRCTREEYLIAQEYLKTASDDIKDLYDVAIVVCAFNFLSLIIAK